MERTSFKRGFPRAALPEDDAARAIWAVVERLDLSALYAPTNARGETAGASAIDPKILLAALCVYATTEGEGDAPLAQSASVDPASDAHVAGW